MHSWRNRSFALSLCASLCSWLPGCADETVAETQTELVGPDYDEQIAAASELSERPCPDDAFLSYENFGAPFIVTWCNGCHNAALAEGTRANAPLGVDFGTVESIREQAARIWARAGDHNLTMPPAGDPDPLEREMLGEWLACGAPVDGEL